MNKINNKKIDCIDNIEKEKIIVKDNENPSLFKYKYQCSDILTSNLKNILKIDKSVFSKNDNIDKLNNGNELHLENKIISIKNKLCDKYKKLSKIDKKDWSNSIEIDEIEKEIEVLILEYKKINNLIKEEYNIFNEENNDLNILFNDDYDENIDEIEKLPNIEISINGININKIKNYKSVFQINTSNEIKTLIDNMENDFEICKEKIKRNMKNNIKDNYIKFLLISKLNEILSMIKLLKINYEDLKNY